MVSILLSLTPVFALLVGLLYFVLDDSTLLNASPSSAVRTSTPALDAIKAAFSERYGRDSSQAMLANGIRKYGSIQTTAERMLRAAAHNRPFVMAFGGYSVTVGRGNYFNQSFPFVTKRVLGQTFQDLLGIPLEVRNAAIGGIPSFPYGFCMKHFLGDDADVISWDYSMNEGKGATVLESYIRHGLALPHQPMILLLDTTKERCDILEQYSDMGILGDAISLAKGEVVDKTLLALPDDQRPPGLREWDQFGAPGRCPGRSSWHPKRMEHELMGWMLAMHMVEGVEEAMRLMKLNDNWKLEYGQYDIKQLRSFPPPVNKVPENEESVTHLLFGHPEGNNKYTLKDISCRTSFLPAVDQNGFLPSIIVSGLHHVESDMMLERTDAMYTDGWVLDVSHVERDTKAKVERCGGLGYIDMKVALYGIPESGTLRLWLPYEGPTQSTKDDAAAKNWFDTLILCEANEKRKEDACQLDKHMLIIVGGVEVETIFYIDGAGVYLHRKTCVNIAIPMRATTTKLGQVKDVEGNPLTSVDMTRLAGSNHDDNMIGLVVDIKARKRVSRENGACCVSHIIWEQH